MNNLNIFLKSLTRIQYPGPTVSSVASFCDYDLNNFLLDLVKEIGEEKTWEFIEHGVNKFLREDKTYKLDISDLTPGPSYIVLSIELTKEYDSNSVFYKWETIDSKITDTEGNSITFQEIFNDLDFSEHSNWDEFVDAIFGKFADVSKENLGYYLAND